jgi:hypothetical protein
MCVRVSGLGGQVIPLGVCLFNEGDLPFPAPVLQLLLAAQGILGIRELFYIYKHREAVLLGEAGYEGGLMLCDSAFDVVGDADVEGAVSFVREYVDIHGVTTPWVLNQVQDDGIS